MRRNPNCKNILGIYLHLFLSKFEIVRQERTLQQLTVRKNINVYSLFKKLPLNDIKKPSETYIVHLPSADTQNHDNQGGTKDGGISKSSPELRV